MARLDEAERLAAEVFAGLCVAIEARRSGPCSYELRLAPRDRDTYCLIRLGPPMKSPENLRAELIGVRECWTENA